MRHAFTQLELLVSLMIVAVVISMVTIGTSEQRRNANLNASLSNLKTFGWGTSTYAADYNDLFWSFSWEPGVDYGFGGAAPTPVQAHANQAVEIMRRLADRQDINVITGWIPHLLYSHLVLVDHLGGALPASDAVSPADALRLRWAEDPAAFVQLTPGAERPSGFGNSLSRWPYSSSYLVGPAFFSPDTRSTDGRQTINQHGQTHNRYNAGNSVLGGRRMTEVAFPNQKVLMHDAQQRHFGPRCLYFALLDARIPMLFADGSARVRITSDANPGFQPNNPTSPGPSRIAYQPEGWECPTSSGGTRDLVDGMYRYTRGGLGGRDFDGPEVEWVD